MKKREDKKSDEVKFLDVTAAMRGSLVFSDPVNLRISGKFDGDLTTKGNLIIGKNATVTADIIGENIAIAGIVKGDIKASRLVELGSTAEVVGNIETPRLAVDKGAVLNGNCRMAQVKMSIEELSDYLSVGESKIMEWVGTGAIPAEKSGSNLLFDHKEVETWLSQNS
ncbi:MAG: helix-turn-helix domain-containing protein [Candidatus Omnitrophica bacterium]|nr:helix-turn-helix domain-containing protein [Candidatus Omnitrophota bacterium]